MPRGRVKRLDQPVKLTCWIPESVDARMRLQLYSEVEGRIPYNSISGLVSELLTEWLNKKEGVK